MTGAIQALAVAAVGSAGIGLYRLFSGEGFMWLGFAAILAFPLIYEILLQITDRERK